MPGCTYGKLFQDNKDDVLYLCSEEGKQAIVKTHVEAITRYIQKYGKWFKDIVAILFVVLFSHHCF